MVGVKSPGGVPRKPKKESFMRELVKQWDLQLMVVPALLFILLFSYVPMYGIMMAFQEFRMGDFPGFSKWEGFKQFQYLFKDPNFMTVLRNTVAISGLKLLICFPLPIILAIALNEITNLPFKKSVQTISYLPHFISWVVGATLMFDFLSADNGAVNNMLKSLGLIKEPIMFFGKGEYFWPIAVFTDLWKELGWNAIIYIAAITAIDAELYEAAEIDGAGRYAKMWHITVATIRPTILLLLIMTVGNLLNANFDQIMTLTNQMGNAKLRSFADVIDTYVYRMGIGQARFSYAAAAGLFKAVINFALLLGANWLSEKAGETALF